MKAYVETYIINIYNKMVLTIFLNNGFLIINSFGLSIIIIIKY